MVLPRLGAEAEVVRGLHCSSRRVLLVVEYLLALQNPVAEAPWSVAEWAVALRFDNPRATVLVLLLG